MIAARSPAPTFPRSLLLSNATYYVRLFTYIPGASSYSDSSFTTGTGTGVLRYPADGATGLDGRHMLFTWSSDPTASSYYLYVGTTPGAKDVVDSGETTANYWVSLSDPFQPNTTYYATLWVKRKGQWAGTATTLTTGAPSGELLYPAAGATSVDPTQGNFSWSPVTFANNYYLIIGSAVGQNDVLDTGQITGTNLMVGNLLGGQTYYVRFYSRLAGQWSYLDSTFQTGPVPMPASPAALYSQVIGLISQVRAMADPHTNIPVPGSLLESKTFARGYTQAFCTDYANTLLQLLENNQIAARTRTIVFDPLDTHVIDEFYDPFQSKWVIADPTFGAMYFDSSTMTGNSVEEISSLVINSNWSSIPLNWVTSYGESIWDQYYLDPILLFLNPLSVSPVTVPVPVPNDPSLLVSPETISQTGGAAGTYIFRFAQPTDVVTISNPGHSQFTLGVTPPTREWGLTQVLSTDWSAISAPAGLQVYSPPRLLGAVALPGIVTAPANGATGVNPGAATITWNPDSTAIVYYPYLGTSQGANDVFNYGEQPANSTSVIARQLASYMTYWIRMWIKRSAGWSYTDSHFTTGPADGTVISPANDATGVNPGAVTITWTPDSTAIAYYPYLGTSQGTNDVFNYGEQPANSTSVIARQLASYTTYWIRMWIKRSAGWSYTATHTSPPDPPTVLSLVRQTALPESIPARSLSPGHPTVRRPSTIPISEPRKEPMTSLTSASSPRTAPASTSGTWLPARPIGFACGLTAPVPGTIPTLCSRPAPTSP